MSKFIDFFTKGRILIVVILLVVGGIVYYEWKSPSTSPNIMSINDLNKIDNNVNCGGTFPNEGKKIITEGYIFPGDLDVNLTQNRYGYVLRNNPDMINNVNTFIEIKSNIDNIVFELRNKHSNNPLAWIHVRVFGVC
jgi:hypothetical protein